MTAESFTFGTPGTTDANDGSQLYVMGCFWTTSADATWTGVQWRVPDTVSGDNHYILAYEDGDGDTPRQSKLVTPTPGGLQTFTFNTPIAVTTGVTYVACILTNHYVFTNPYTFPHTDGHLTATKFQIKTTTADDAKFPDSVSALNFHVSPVVDGFPIIAALGRVDETDTSRALGRVHTRDLGLASEADGALVLGRVNARVLHVTGELDEALPLRGFAATPILRTPTIDEHMEVYSGLFRFYQITRGITLLVSGDVVTETRFPWQEDLLNYDFVYLGGHEYELSGAEVATLMAAGYGAFIT